MNSKYFVKVEQFEGPLDLLLHLIKLNEIDIFNINIFELTNQYLEYLRILEFDNLQQAGEFLEMAATLIEIKSRLLLPQGGERLGTDEDNTTDDTLINLQQRLIEYERFKQAAKILEQSYCNYPITYSSYECKRLEPFYEGIELPLQVDATMLVVLYEQLLKNIPQKKQGKIHAKINKVNIDEKIEEILSLLENFNFALFQSFYNRFASRYELVIYILAILELIKLGKIRYYQESALGPLWIYKYDFDEQNLPLSKEEKVRLLRVNTEGINEINSI